MVAWVTDGRVGTVGEAFCGAVSFGMLLTWFASVFICLYASTVPSHQRQDLPGRGCEEKSGIKSSAPQVSPPLLSPLQLLLISPLIPPPSQRKDRDARSVRASCPVRGPVSQFLTPSNDEAPFYCPFPLFISYRSSLHSKVHFV